MTGWLTQSEARSRASAARAKRTSASPLARGPWLGRWQPISMSVGLRAAPVLEPAVGSYYSLAAPRARPRRYLSRKDTAMPYPINPIPLKAPDPRKTPAGSVGAFAVKLVPDETRAFGDRV